MGCETCGGWGETGGWIGKRTKQEQGHSDEMKFLLGSGTAKKRKILVKGIFSPLLRKSPVN